MTHDCDTHAAATAPADKLAWSDCDDEPFLSDCEPSLYSIFDSAAFDAAEPPSRWWTWPIVAAAWVAGAAALAVVIGLAYVALTPQQQPTAPQRSSVSSVPSPNGGTIVAPTSLDLEPPQNT